MEAARSSETLACYRNLHSVTTHYYLIALQFPRCRGGPVRTETRLRAERQGNNSRQGRWRIPLPYRVQTGSESHPASVPGAEVKNVQSYTSIPSIYHGVVFNYARDSRDSSVGTALGYGMDDRGSRFRFSAGDGNFSLHHRVQNGYGTHPASYPMGTRGSFPGNKVAWIWPLTYI
jgi:hypothetical protein